MKKLKKCTPILLLLLSISLVCATCNKKEEDYDDITYHKTIGIGYVFLCDSNGKLLCPVHGAEIEVSTALKGNNWNIFGGLSYEDILTTDKTGKYQVRFVKRTKLCDAAKYFLDVSYTPEGENIGWLRSFDLYPEDIINAPNNILLIDTIKLDINEHKY